MDKQLKFFSLHSIIFRISFDLTTLYGVIYFYQKFQQSLIIALGSFVVIHLLYALFIPIFINTITQTGSKYSLIIAIIFFCFSAITLIVIQDNPTISNLSVYVITQAIARTFYHIPHHIYITRGTHDKTRGTSYGIYTAVVVFFSGFATLFGGNVLQKYLGYGYAILNILLLILSLIPLLFLDNYRFIFSNNLLKVLRLKNIQKLRNITFANVFHAQAGIVWHIYVFLLLGSSYLNIGYLYAIVITISSLMAIIFGKYLDGHNRKKFFKNSAIITVVTWLLRSFAHTPVSVFIADTIFSINRQLRNEVFDVISYDLTSINNAEELFDEAIALREIIMNVFTAIGISCFLLITLIFGYETTFFFAAISAFVIYLI